MYDIIAYVNIEHMHCSSRTKARRQLLWIISAFWCLRVREHIFSLPIYNLHILRIALLLTIFQPLPRSFTTPLPSLSPFLYLFCLDLFLSVSPFSLEHAPSHILYLSAYLSSVDIPLFTLTLSFWEKPLAACRETFFENALHKTWILKVIKSHYFVLIVKSIEIYKQNRVNRINWCNISLFPESWKFYEYNFIRFLT